MSTNGNIDFSGLVASLLSQARVLLPRWYPAGKFQGKEFVVGSRLGEAGESLKINTETGAWAEFAAGSSNEAKGRDMVSYFAYREGIPNGEAAKNLAKEIGFDLRPGARASTNEPTTLPASDIVKPPPGKSAPSGVHDSFGTPSAIWRYPDANGDHLFYIARYDPVGARKQFVPWTWDGDEWRAKAPPDPRPIYGLDLLEERPEPPVLIVEGEKAADAARKIAGKLYVVVCWPGGSSAWQKVNWKPLAGRKVLLWPDADRKVARTPEHGVEVGGILPIEYQPGYKAMDGIAGMLNGSALEVKLINPGIDEERKDGWDAADALAERWDWAQFKKWATTRVKVVPSTPSKETTDSLRIKQDEPYIPEILSGETSEDSLALEFARRYAADLRYVAAWGQWLHYDGARWRSEPTLLAFDLARIISREVIARFPKRNTSDNGTRAATVAAIERMAKADRRIAATTEQWDIQPWLLNTPGGVVDLKTGEARTHERNDYLTKITTAAPGPGCLSWMEFLNDITGGDEELQAYLARIVGYALTGMTTEHALFFLYGTGANGKSVFLNTIEAVFGDYAMTAPGDTFMETKGDRHPTDLAALRGARMVCSIEIDQGKRWAEAKLKSLTGGDTISARFMRQDFFEFVPQFKLFIAGNHKPAIRGVDEAMRRRIHLIPFTVTIPPEKRDQSLAKRLLAERDGILGWAIKGCLEWQRIGLQPPEAVLGATQDYFTAEDTLGRWITEACRQDANATATTKVLFAAWKAWAEGSGEFVGTEKRFATELEAHGFGKWVQPGTRHHGFRGVALA